MANAPANGMGKSTLFRRGYLPHGRILLCVCVLVSLTDTLDLGSRAPPYITFAAVAVIGTATISDLRSYLSLGTETLQTLSDYSHVLLPVLLVRRRSVRAAGAQRQSTPQRRYAWTCFCPLRGAFSSRAYAGMPRCPLPTPL